MKTLHINVKDKIATYTQRDGAVVCGNSDYQISFTFDSEWDEYPNKTARFIWNGQHFDQPFTGDVCPMPMVYGTTSCLVGVYVENLETTTPAKIDCLKSVLCDKTVKHGGNDKAYADEAKEAAIQARNSADVAVSASRSAEEYAVAAADSAISAESNVRTALTEAKASGEFDGADGKDGEDGKNGYTPVKGVDYFDGKDGKDGYTPVKGVDYFDGANGKDGENGISATHSWNGTTLTITSASGTSSANLKGDKGDTGAQGIQGEKGDKGDKGDPYTLTDTDKNEISDDVKASLPSEPWTFTVENDNGSTSTVVKDVYVDDGVGGSQNPSRICNINNGISVIDAGLTYARGVVEVRKTGSILWLIDSGVYNFTADFKQANNRTVLQFDLPKWLSNKMPNVNGVYGGTGTIGYFPALAYENVTYTTFNCQSYLKRYAVGTDADTFQLVYTGLNAVSGGGLCGFHLKMPILLIDAEG